MDYLEQLDRLSFHAEFLRREMAEALQSGHDVSAVHEKLDCIRSQRVELALKENRFDWDDACLDLDASQARAMMMPNLPIDGRETSLSVHGLGGVRH